MKIKFQIKKALALLLFISLIISSLASLTACTSGIGGTSNPAPPDELLATISEPPSKSFDTVAGYLDFWGFPEFSRSKLETLENLYRKQFVSELPSAYEKAYATGKYFIENYYNGEKKSIEETTDMLIHSFVETTGDNYSIYRTAEEYTDYNTGMSGSFVGIGVMVRYSADTSEMIVETVHDGGAKDAGILPGDRIIKVNGESIEALGYKTAVSNIKGDVGTTVSVTVRRGEEEISFAIIRRQINETSVSYEIANSIAYIKITSFKTNTTDQFKEAVDAALNSGAKGIIYDLRSNSGGYLSTVLDMLDYIAPKGTMLASFTNDYMDPKYSKTNHAVTLPSVVICNGSTASAAELFTAAIRDFSNMGFFEARIVGEKTFGKGIMQNTYLFSDKSKRS